MDETVTRSELKSLIFSDETRTHFSEFIQSTIMSRYDPSPKNFIEETSPAHSSHYFEQSRKRRMSTYVAEEDDTWICGTITIPTLLRRYVGIARLKHATNFGPTLEGFLIHLTINNTNLLNVFIFQKFYIF